MNKINYSLSNFDIEKKLNNKVKIITHSEIKNYKNIDDLLQPYDKVVILYKNSKNYGHWTCLFRNDEGINFFDSYGGKIDGIKKFIPLNLNKELNQDHKNLIKLLIKSNENIHYNNHQLQKLDPNINTCGRWVVFRLLNTYLTHDEFNELFKNRNKTSDELITLLVPLKNS